MDDSRATEHYGNGRRLIASTTWIDEGRMWNIRRVSVERASQSKQSSVLGIMSLLCHPCSEDYRAVCCPNGFGNPPDAATG